MTRIDVPTLVTDRLILRAARAADFNAYSKTLMSPRAAYVGGPFNLEDAWYDFAGDVASWILRGYGWWVIERISDGAFLGTAGLAHPAGDPEPELGWILQAEAEGQGYAQEAAIAARDYAFGSLGWRDVVSYIDPGNARSIALAERLGAVRDKKAEAAVTDMLVYRHHAPQHTAPPRQQPDPELPLRYDAEVPTLMTQRLTLRPHRREDFDAYAAFFASARAAHVGQIDRRAAWHKFAGDVGSWSLLGFGPWAVSLRPEDVLVGQVGVGQPAHFAEPELGWILFDGYEGQGYAFEAATAARRFARDTLGLNGLVSYIDRDNARSIRLAERLGARLESTTDGPDPEDLVYRHPMEEIGA